MSDYVSILYGLPSSSEREDGWRAEGLCRGLREQDPGLAAAFFAETVAEQSRAKALCGQCPVRANCLEYGLHEPTGIWGGEGVRERQRRLARARQARVE